MSTEVPTGWKRFEDWSDRAFHVIELAGFLCLAITLLTWSICGIEGWSLSALLTAVDMHWRGALILLAVLFLRPIHSFMRRLKSAEAFGVSVNAADISSAREDKTRTIPAAALNKEPTE